MELITKQQHKLNKSAKMGYMTAGLTLSPANESSRNTCSHSTPGCRVGWLKTAGRHNYDPHELARVRRTDLLFNKRDQFYYYLSRELMNLERRAKKANLLTAFRPNILSDLPFEKIFPQMFVEHSNIQFYDYTKNPHRMQKFLDGTDWPWNYHLAFSLSENFNNQAHAYSFIRQGGQIAVVFKNESAPQYGLPNHEDELFDVINGDIDDCLWTHNGGIIIGLLAKGRGRKDTTGFVKE